MVKYLLLFSLLFFSVSSSAQKDKFPKDYFIFPMKPGQQNFLSGTMGELRSNHFHAGLDIKTFGQIGWPIHACADGYVSRIKISPYGYGRALYIQHTNGYTTVYAHLSKMSEQIEKHVLQEQYKQESFYIDISLPPSKFPVKQKDVVAYSGNTGSSQGPHLHWEIRDEWQATLNPLLFGFTEIKDNIKPLVYEIALTTLSEDARINQEFGKQYFKPKNHGNRSYTLPVINAHGTLGLSIKTRDRLNGANNPNGIAGIVMKIDGEEAFHYYNKRVSFAETKFINQHIDYETYKYGKGRFHKCYVDDGNKLNFYSKNAHNGKIVVKEEKIYDVEITVWDAYNNKSVLNFKLNGMKPQRLEPSKIDSTAPKKIFLDEYENILKVACKNCSEGEVIQFKNRTHLRSAPPTYYKGNNSVYLLDLRDLLPTSITLDDTVIQTHYKMAVPGQRKFTYNYDNVALTFSNKTIYDTLYLKYEHLGDTFRINDVTIPVHSNMTITMKARGQFDKSKAAVFMKFGKSESFVGGTWNGDKITFRTREFGEYIIKEDTTKPEIRYYGRVGNGYRFRIKDKESGIKSYKAYIDGKWVLLEYDYLKKLVTTRSIDDTLPTSGELKLLIEDEMGNVAEFRVNL